MLNKEGQRELAYIAQVTNITPIEGAENVELAHVNGWTVMVRKGAFQIGDPCVYFEIDSKVPETAEFEFMEKYKYRVKTQKYFKGKVLSQGLIMTLAELNLTDCKVGDFVTERLGVIYYEVEDNIRKADNKKLAEIKADKFMEKWSRKHPHLSKIKFIYNFRRNRWLKGYLKKNYKKKPEIFWQVTDEERCQNLPNLFINNDKYYMVTEKIDGTSTTFGMQQGKKRIPLVSSRRVVQDLDRDKYTGFYSGTDGNVYVEMFEKYNIEKILNYILDEHPEYENIVLQGETYGGTIQKRNYGPEHRFALFNYIYKKNGEAPVRLNPVQMKEVVETINKECNTELETVPVLDTDYKLPSTCEELLEYAEGVSVIDRQPREGLVFRDNKGEESFKAVSNSFLLKYHS